MIKQKNLKLNDPIIFLSYAKEDVSKVKKIYRNLINEELTPWVDFEDLLPGQDWEHQIKKTIRSAKFVLVFLSNRSTNKKGYIQKEIREALDVSEQSPEGEIFIIPVRLEECHVPERLINIQWIDIFKPYGIKKLIEAIRIHLGEEYTNPPHKYVPKIKSPTQNHLFNIMVKNKIKKRGSFVYSFFENGNIVISDGVFLEVFDKKPPFFDKLKESMSISKEVKEENVNNIIEVIPENKIYKYLLKEIKFPEDNNYKNIRILISSSNIKCGINNEYLIYGLQKFPDASVLIIDPLKPILFQVGNKIKYAVMPYRI